MQVPRPCEERDQEDLLNLRSPPAKGMIDGLLIRWSLIDLLCSRMEHLLPRRANLPVEYKLGRSFATCKYSRRIWMALQGL